MSFKDFNDEGPGAFAWDYVLGGNTTGMFPEETHYEVYGDTLKYNRRRMSPASK